MYNDHRFGLKEQAFSAFGCSTDDGFCATWANLLGFELGRCFSGNTSAADFTLGTEFPAKFETKRQILNKAGIKALLVVCHACPRFDWTCQMSNFFCRME
jgi:hypothetical protein